MRIGEGQDQGTPLSDPAQWTPRTMGRRRFNPCPKCGEPDPRATYVYSTTTAPECLRYRHKPNDAEHFHAYCERCTFRWEEPL
jgi:hypothetical protein